MQLVNRRLQTLGGEGADVVLNDFYHKMWILQWEILGGYIFMFLLSGSLLLYLRHNRKTALLGDASAARKTLLPAFEPLLWIVLGISSVFVAFLSVVLGNDMYPTGLTQGQAEGFIIGRNFNASLVILFMHQKSLSIPGKNTNPKYKLNSLH